MNALALLLCAAGVCHGFINAPKKPNYSSLYGIDAWPKRSRQLCTNSANKDFSIALTPENFDKDLLKDSAKAKTILGKLCRSPISCVVIAKPPIPGSPDENAGKPTTASFKFIDMVYDKRGKHLGGGLVISNKARKMLNIKQGEKVLWTWGDCTKYRPGIVQNPETARKKPALQQKRAKMAIKKPSTQNIPPDILSPEAYSALYKKLVNKNKTPY